MTTAESTRTAAQSKSRDQQLAAIIASGAIMAFFVVYWFGEVQEVRAMLKLAYG
jgi:hypothetical protein